MDAGNRYSDWPLFIDSAIGQRFRTLQNMVLVHAARYAADLSYLPLMQELEKRYEETAHSDGGQSGNGCGFAHWAITELIESGELEARLACR